MPWTAKRVLGCVPDTPSLPPSFTRTCSMPTTARWPKATAPGTNALNELFTEHVPPTAGFAVAPHVMSMGTGMSIIVAASVPPPGADRVVAIGEAPYGVTLQLAGVVVQRRLPAHVGDLAIPRDIGLIRARALVVGDHPQPQEPDRVGSPTVRVRRADREVL